jgi:hypothetical protein
MSGLFDSASGYAGAGLVFLTVCPRFCRIDQAASGLGGGMAVRLARRLRF